jgi:hypothetical protein
MPLSQVSVEDLSLLQLTHWLGFTLVGPRRSCFVSLKEATSFRDRKIAFYLMPRCVKTGDEFPMTITGKIRKIETSNVFSSSHWVRVRTFAVS